MLSAILKKWRSSRAWSRDHAIAWQGQEIVGEGDLTPFQREAINSLATDLHGFRQHTLGTREHYLRCEYPGTNVFLLVYRDGAEVHGPIPWRAEQWDFATPADLIHNMVAAARSNISFERTPDGAAQFSR
jgi:hypothetical protein